MTDTRRLMTLVVARGDRTQARGVKRQVAKRGDNMDGDAGGKKGNQKTESGGTARKDKRS